jgi:excisionase family DNA binding protein
MEYVEFVQSTLYSAEDVAAVLGLHVRTVRGYVRDGRLPAVRIGKQYRITEEALQEFTGGRRSPAATPPAAPRIEVSAIVQIEPAGRRLTDRITTHVVAAANSGSADRPRLHVQTVYDEGRDSLKIIAVGSPDDTAKMLTLISALAGDEGVTP